jgi:hypothetical protein
VKRWKLHAAAVPAITTQDAKDVFTLANRIVEEHYDENRDYMFFAALAVVFASHAAFRKVHEGSKSRDLFLVWLSGTIAELVHDLGGCDCGEEKHKEVPS